MQDKNQIQYSAEFMHDENGQAFDIMFYKLQKKNKLPIFNMMGFEKIMARRLELDNIQDYSQRHEAMTEFNNRYPVLGEDPIATLKVLQSQSKPLIEVLRSSREYDLEQIG